MEMYISPEDLLQAIERDMDSGFLATKSVSIDASAVTVPTIQPRQNQASLRGVHWKVPVVNAMHSSPAAESIKVLQIFNRES